MLPLSKVIAIFAPSSTTKILFLFCNSDEMTCSLFMYIFSLHTKNITNMGNNENTVNESVFAKN